MDAGWRATFPGAKPQSRFGVAAGATLVLTSPVIAATWRASQSAGAQFYPLSELSFWSASLNSLPAPYISHPWLSRVASAIFQGIGFESGAANYGLAATIAALVGAVVARRHKAWWPATVVAAFGLILALGVVLKWNDTPVRASALVPLNRVLWQAGHALKPDVFAASPTPAFEEAIPLPGFLLTLVVPFFERARVFRALRVCGEHRGLSARCARDRAGQAGRLALAVRRRPRFRGVPARAVQPALPARSTPGL